MKSESPFSSTLKWIAVGAITGFVLMIAINALRGSHQELNDQALDELARHQGGP
ncbi:MAG: hypothetical protein V4502_06415 [Pseudomonadota bacterium]